MVVRQERHQGFVTAMEDAMGGGEDIAFHRR